MASVSSQSAEVYLLMHSSLLRITVDDKREDNNANVIGTLEFAISMFHGRMRNSPTSTLC